MGLPEGFFPDRLQPEGAAKVRVWIDPKFFDLDWRLRMSVRLDVHRPALDEFLVGVVVAAAEGVSTYTEQCEVWFELITVVGEGDTAPVEVLDARVRFTVRRPDGLIASMALHGVRSRAESLVRTALELEAPDNSAASFRGSLEWVAVDPGARKRHRGGNR